MKKSAEKKQNEIFKKFHFFLFIIDELLNRIKFFNFYVNDFKKWLWSMKSFCINCEKLEHFSTACTEKKFEKWKRTHFKLIMYENKNVTFYFITVEAQNFFSNSNYDFFFMISDITESDSSVITENSFSVIIVTIFTQSVSVKFILINFIFNVADSFLKKNDFNKKIHVKKSFFQFTDLDFRYSSEQSVQFQISFI